MNRKIKVNKITRVVQELCQKANFELNSDILNIIKASLSKENKTSKNILNNIIKNSKIARAEKLPLCQDTGLAIIFVEIGQEATVVGGSLEKAIQKGVALGYKKGNLRKSVLNNVFDRINTKTNTPAIIHYEIVPGNKLKIKLMSKGGGAENKSQVKMFNPSANENDVIKFVIDVVKQAGAQACPPLIVGIGMGGNFEYSAYLSKKALLRKTGKPNLNKKLAKFEKNILNKLNQTKIGPQGLGGKTTALAVQVESFPCHLAAFPVAVNIECHSHRIKEAIL